MITSMREHKGYLYHRRHPQQPRRPAEARRRRSGLDRPGAPIGAAMIGAFTHIFDTLFGRGEAAVTVPPLDGALRPEPAAGRGDVAYAARRCGLPRGCRTARCWRPPGSRIVASEATVRGRERSCQADHDHLPRGLAGRRPRDRAWRMARSLIEGGPFDGRSYWRRWHVQLHHRAGRRRRGHALSWRTVRRPTVSTPGSAICSERNASGSLWRIDLDRGTATRACRWAGLAGRAVPWTTAGSVFSEAWKHQLVRLDIAAAERGEVLYADLPGYPGRIAPATRRLLAGAVRAAQPAGRVRAARARLSQAHDGRGAAADFWVAPKLQVRPQLLRVAAGRRREASRHAQALGADHVRRLLRQARSARSSRAPACRAAPTATPMASPAPPSMTGALYVAARGDGVVVSLPLGESDAGAAA